jgi:hypothetical protein
MSFNFSDRRWDDLTPKTKEMASILFDFPEPLGPMMEVKYESPKRRVWRPR